MVVVRCCILLILRRRKLRPLLLLLLLLRTVSSQHLHPKYSTAPNNQHQLNLHKGRRRLLASNSWSWPPWATNWEQRASCSCLNCNNYYNWQRRRPNRKIVHQRHRVRCWVPLPLPYPFRANNIIPSSRRTCRIIKFHHNKQRHLLALMLALTPPRHKLLVAWRPIHHQLSLKTFNPTMTAVNLSLYPQVPFLAAVLMMASSAQQENRKVTTEIPMETTTAPVLSTIRLLLLMQSLVRSLPPRPPPISTRATRAVQIPTTSARS